METCNTETNIEVRPVLMDEFTPVEEKRQMTREEVLQILKEASERCECADLRNANLRNANLRNANLENANLENANLRNANLRDANLDYANLRNANLENANLDYADLRNANLRNANLRNANLRNANLENANLRNANLRDANLRNANLDYAHFTMSCCFSRMSIDLKIAYQLLAHLCSMKCEDKEFSEIREKILPYATKSHRAEDLDLIENKYS